MSAETRDVQSENASLGISLTSSVITTRVAVPLYVSVKSLEDVTVRIPVELSNVINVCVKNNERKNGRISMFECSLIQVLSRIEFFEKIFVMLINKIIAKTNKISAFNNVILFVQQ